MKIGMVFDGLLMGGISKVGLDYCHLLQKLGNDVTIINLRPKNKELESKFNTKIVHFNFSKNLAPEKYSKLEKMYSIGRFIYPVTFVIIRLFNYLYSVVYRVFYDHDRYDLIISFSGHFNDLSFVAYNFANAKRKIAWLHGALFEYMLNSEGYLRLYKNIKNLVVLSDLNQIAVDTCNKYLKLNISKLYNPTSISSKPIDEYKVKELKEKYGDYCLMVSRISKDKDHITIIKAMQYLNTHYKLNKKLVLVGDGELKDYVQKYVKDNNLEKMVFFEGNRNDVQNYYKSAYIFVHSSPLEGLPTTLIEALYLGLPIVSTDSMPGVREVLNNGENGLISPVFDHIALADNIYRLYNDTELYISLKTGGYIRAKVFSPEVILPELKKILDGIQVK